MARINVILPDMDGALLYGLKKSDTIDQNLEKRRVFLTHLKNIPGEKILMSGSNRQDLFIDEMNSTSKNSPLSFPLLPEIANYIGATFIPFFMPDAETNQSVGTTYEIAKNSGFKARNPNNLQWKNFDDTKISLIFAIAQHVLAIKGDKHPIDIHFYDDREDILSNLKEYFERLPSRLASNIQLHLHQYTGGNEATHYHTLQGTGNGDLI